MTDCHHINAFDRHSGLDPLSPERQGYTFTHRRWRMFLRHDGKGIKVVISSIVPKQQLND